jgi:membrane associated rhomboid family serine protease
MQRARIGMPAWLGRLPAVSLALALLWLLTTAAVEVGFAEHGRRVEAEVDAAVRFAIQNPAVAIHTRLLPAVRAVMPGFESNEMFAFLRKASGGGDGPTLQEQFDVMAARAFDDLDAHPHRALGVVPAALSPHAFATHWILHAGWLHLLASVLLWLLVAPLLEELWGRRVFAGAVLVIVLGGAGVFALVHRSADRALIGSAGLVVALCVAAAVRFGRQEVDLLRWTAPWTQAQLSVPAWVLAALAGAYVGALPLAVGGALPAGLDDAVGWTALAVGGLLGAGCAVGARDLGWEERFGRSAPPVEQVTRSERFDFQQVLAARARGDGERAFAMLEAEMARSARHRDAVTTFWEMCIERKQPERAAPAMLQLVREELRRGAAEIAVAQWREMSEHLPQGCFDPGTLLRLVPLVQRIDGDEHAVLALQQVLAVPQGELAAPLAAQTARLARELDPELALAAARRALARPGLDEAAAAEMRGLVARLAPVGEGGDPGEQDKPQEEGAPAAPAPSVFYAESDRSSFGEAGDLSSLASDFPRGVVCDATPQGLSADTISILAEGAAQTIALSRVRAVAVAGVHGVSDKPVVLIDLLLDGGGGERPLSVVRFRSDRYDPRRLAPRASGPLDALRAIAGALVSRCRARPLPTADAVACRPVPVYSSLEEYHASVLRPVADELA